MSSSRKKPRKNPRDNKNSPTASTDFSFPNLPLPPSPTSIYNVKVPVKLNEENYLIWCLLVEPVIDGHRHLFVTDSAIYPSVGNDDFGERDQIMFSWLLSTLSESMLKQVIGCRNTKQLWVRLHNFFKIRAHAKVGKYLSKLTYIVKKDTESITEYLLRIKILMDSLEFAGRPVNLQEQVDAILGGLPEEYDAEVTLINTRTLNGPPISVDDIEHMILVRESQLSFNGDI